MQKNEASHNLRRIRNDKHKKFIKIEHKVKNDFIKEFINFVSFKIKQDWIVDKIVLSVVFGNRIDKKTVNN